MTIHTIGGPSVRRVPGRLLCDVAAHNRNDVAVIAHVAALTAAHPESGLVVRGRRAVDVVRRWGSGRGGPAQLVVADAGAWTSMPATADVPLRLPADEDVLFPLGLDEWAAPWLDAGAQTVLTPAGFVEADEWAALKAVLVAGTRAADPRVTTLVATDAAMLDPARWPRFCDAVGEQHGGRSLAFVFAARSGWLATQPRMARLRELVGAFPGSLVIATEVLAATDVVVHGGDAAIGLRSAQRQPRRPQDKNGGRQAEGWKPGMFLRELWETHSPDFYMNWYGNRPAPVCPRCGRGPESFTADSTDRDAVLVHNVHAWLDVLTDLRRQGEHARNWLAGERWRAREAHRDIGPPGTGVPVDPLLAALCGLDGPRRQHRPAPAP